MFRFAANSLIFLFVLFMAATLGFSQEKSSGFIEKRKEVADSVGVFYFYDSSNLIVAPAYYPIDTALHHFHHYQALQGRGRIYAGLGNTGLAYSQLVFDNRLPTESQFGIKSFDAYRYTPYNQPYYKLNLPFSILNYASGKNREQVFSGRHYQQVVRNLGIGANFTVYNALGLYDRQKSDNVSAAFYALFRTQNKRYGIAGSFISNRFIHRENGGISDPAQFENNIEPDRERVAIKLYAAENRWRETNTSFKQYLHLSAPEFLDNDSIHKAFRGFGTLVHKFNYQRLAQVYDDSNPKSGFYPDIFIDSTRTTDSLVLHTVYNDLQWVLPLVKNDFLNLTITSGLAHVFMHYRMFEINNKYHQVIPFFTPTIKFGEKIVLSAHFQRIMGDFRNNDQELEIMGSYRIKNHDPIVLEGFLNRSARTPGLFYQLFQSNHFEWDNNFDQQHSNEVLFNAKWRNIKAGFSFKNMNGFAYLDTLSHPAWYADPINLYSLFADLRLSWRKFTFDNKITFQHLSDENALRLPALLLNGIFSYQLSLFKGALQAMGGLELSYNTAWKAPAYMPAIRSFYLQNEKETGNYLYADVFINLRIKRARLFLMVQHANKGLMGYHYYMIPNYPMPDRALKFGVSWMFYD